ncbi:MAG TPA: CPBP family intramembrane glutamic endopeptidase [Terriglobia bacterium]|nr:CPBP family intramembrane glutamic endopeptidase [Terriglobia bacterium]
MPIKLTSRQYRNIGIAVALAAASLVVVLKYFSRAFPEASIEFRVDRSESERIAGQYLEKRGFVLAGYRHAAIFDYDDMAKLYLERTQGLQRMDRLTRGPVHLWRWSHRWFRPQQKQEFLVDVTPAGQVVGFDHRIREAAPGANLTQADARRLAETFLKKMGRNLDDLQFVEAQQQKRPARTDYTFTWKQASVNLGEGSLRVDVGVDGNQIASYGEFVKIPESWTRGYEKIRSHNLAAQEVDQVFWVLLSIAMLVILVRRLRDRDVPFKLSFGLGLTAAALDFLSELNTFSLAKFSYNTTSSYSSFAGGYLFDAIMSALGMGTLIFLVVACAEPVYRESFPRFTSIRRYFTWQGLRSRSFFMANAVGLSLAVFFFAYQTIFYLIADRLGAWAPSDIPFSNVLNTTIPWAAVLFTGFFPAISEEMQFRAFAIPFLKRLTGSWPLALVLAAFNWGFLHSAYPNQPFFIRGVEVGVGGIIIGVIMLRFGILATLMWHYSVDALYTAILLLRSPNPYFKISGGSSAGIMLVPLLIALGAYLVSGTFRDEAPITNESEGVSRMPPSEAGAVPGQATYSPLSRRRLVIAAAVVAVFVAVSFVRVYRLGEGIRIRTTAQQVTRSASEFLAGRHADISGYRSVAWLDVNVQESAVTYLSQRLPIQKVDQILEKMTEPLLWDVRFFRPLHQEEYFVFVNATNGNVFDYRHVLDETAPGATLSSTQAEALGRQSVTQNGYNLAGFALQGVRAIKRKAREDYRLVWQAKPGDSRNVGAARYRLQVDIAGNEVVGFSRYLKLPEQWIRQQESTRLFNSLLLALKVLFGAGIVAGAIWLFVRRVRSGVIQWTASLKVAVLLTILFALTILNQSSLLDRAYDTSISLSNFHLQVAMSFVFLGLAAGVLTWLVIALATSLFPAAWQVLRASSRALWRRDAAIALLVTLAVGSGMERLLSLLGDRFHAELTPSFPGVGQSFDARSPAVGALFHAMTYAVVGSAVLAIAIYGVRVGWRRRAWWFWAGGILFLLALGPDGAHSVAEYGVGWLMRFIPLLTGVVILIVFFRNNPLAYITAVFGSVAAPSLVDLFSQPIGFYRWNGVLLSVLAAIVLFWLLAPVRKLHAPT